MEPRVSQAMGSAWDTSQDVKALYDAGTELKEWMGSRGATALVKTIGDGFMVIGGRRSIENALLRHAGVLFQASGPCTVFAFRSERQMSEGLASMAAAAAVAPAMATEMRRDSLAGYAPTPASVARTVPRALDRSARIIGHAVGSLSAPKKYTVLVVELRNVGFPRRGTRSLTANFTAGDLATEFNALSLGPL